MGDDSVTGFADGLRSPGGAPTDGGPALRIDDLVVRFSLDDGDVHAVRGVSFEVDRGEIVALVGESGSGKSVTALSIVRLNPDNRTHTSGSIQWFGEELVGASDARLREIRGNEISVVFQDPLTALNPVYTVGYQIDEIIRAHRSVDRTAVRGRTVEMLDRVGISQPEVQADRYPHEFSGGMRQRVMIAMALANEPRLLIADEPTTALDVTVQAQILELIDDAARQLDASVLLITHDLGVVAGTADRVVVMYAGRVVESAPVDDLFARPTHPYTEGLLASLPSIEATADDGELVTIGGQPPSMSNPPPGCAFHPRCPFASADSRCATDDPPLHDVGARHRVACWVRTDEGAGS